LDSHDLNPDPDKWRVKFTPVPPPGSIACELPADSHEAEIWRDNSGNICARGYIAGGYGWMHLVGAGTFRFDPNMREVAAFALSGVNPDLVREAYCHAALPMALHFFGCEVLHASAVRAPGGVVAFCARSETGKSTMAGALAARGYALWADDAVAIDLDDTHNPRTPIRTRLLPFNLRLRRPSAHYLGEVGARITAAQAGREFAAIPLATLCVLERSGDLHCDVEIKRLSAREAFAALLPHAFCFSVAHQPRKRAMLGLYLRVAAEIPVFSISFAPGFERLPDILSAIENTIPAFAPRSSSDTAVSPQ
jgi:hypothetical protein